METKLCKLSISVFLAIFVLLPLSADPLNLKWRIADIAVGLPQPKYSVEAIQNVSVPMRDGVLLSADIYKPSAKGQFPVVLIRTMYGKENPNDKYSLIGGLFASQGFAVVVQNVRGRFTSGGDFYPFVSEAKDGYDTVEWAGTQPWSNGNVGTYGMSYYGSTQWLAAQESNAHLKAMIPINTSQDPYDRWIYSGIYHLNDVFVWSWWTRRKGLMSEKDLNAVNWAKAVSVLPVIKADDALGEDVAIFNDWMMNSHPGPYWDKVRVDTHIDHIKAPALIIEGWYDYYLNNALADFGRMKNSGGSPEAKQTMMIIGPWTHNVKSKFKDFDFGKSASFISGQAATMVRWFGYWLDGKPNRMTEGLPIKYFTMGENTWKESKTWPPEGVTNEAYYLHSDGKANSLKGSGSLSAIEPLKEAPDTFSSDPLNPVPSVGGTSVYGDLAAKAGPADQLAVESRDDVLVYSTAPFANDTEVSGPVTLNLYVSATTKDFDLAVKLTDVDPKGKSVNIASSVFRASNRDSIITPTPVKEGEVYNFKVLIGHTSILFRKGHRVRIQIAGSNFPEYGRNLNTGEDSVTTSQTVSSRISVYHDDTHASTLDLPVMPRGK